jgi:hypothetical protein
MFTKLYHWFYDKFIKNNEYFDALYFKEIVSERNVYTTLGYWHNEDTNEFFCFQDNITRSKKRLARMVEDIQEMERMCESAMHDVYALARLRGELTRDEMREYYSIPYPLNPKWKLSVCVDRHFRSDDKHIRVIGTRGFYEDICRVSDNNLKSIANYYNMFYDYKKED